MRGIAFGIFVQKLTALGLRRKSTRYCLINGSGAFFFTLFRTKALRSQPQAPGCRGLEQFQLKDGIKCGFVNVSVIS